MQETSDSAAQQDYDRGYAAVMRFASETRRRGWHFTDRQLVREIVQRERAAELQQRSSLPIVNAPPRSAAWYRGQAAALRALLRQRGESC
jgi:hypothetical protein